MSHDKDHDSEVPPEFGPVQRIGRPVKFTDKQHRRVKLKSVMGVVIITKAVYEYVDEVLEAETEGPSPSLLMSMLVDPDYAADAEASMEEYFPKWVAQYGPKKAAIVHRLQVGRIVIGYWLNRILEKAERIAKVVRAFIPGSG